MSREDTFRTVVVRAWWRSVPKELEGIWCDCPRKGRAVLAEECAGCLNAVEFHLTHLGAPHIVCALEVPNVKEVAEAFSTPVSTIMRPRPTCASADCPVGKLLTMVVDQNLGGLPVVDERGCPLGIISKSDLLAEQVDRADESRPPPSPRASILMVRGPGEGPPPEHTAGELMSTPLLSIDETDSVVRASNLMADRHVNKLGVTSGDGRLVGLLTASDLVRWLAAHQPL